MSGHRIVKLCRWTLMGFLLMSIRIYSDTTDVMQPEKLFSMSLRELMNVELEIITAGKIPEKIAEIPASVVLIGRKDIEISGYRSLAEILEHIPGLFPIDDYSWGGMNFGVRGSWTGVANRNVIILVNGVNQTSDLESSFPLNRINVPVEAIDRIEVIRGPMSVIYGTGAFFGVINIITNEIKTDCVSLVSASAGSQNSRSAMLRVAQKKEDLQVVLNASFTSTDGLDVPLSKLLRDPDALAVYSLNPQSRTTRQLENQEKYIGLSGKSKNFNFDMSYAETWKEIYLSYPTYGGGSPYKSANINTAIGYQLSFSDALSGQIKLCYHHTNFQGDYNWLMDNFDMEQKLGETAWEMEANLFYRHKLFDVTLGANHRSATEIFNVITSTTGLDPFMTHLHLDLENGTYVGTKAIFAQSNFSPLERLKIVAGLRLEQGSDYDIGFSYAPFDTTTLNGEKIIYIRTLQPSMASTLSYHYNNWAAIPRAALVYHLNDSHIFKLLYGQAINRPSFQQNVDDFLGMQEKLEPEKISTFELNYLGSASSWMSMGLNMFRNDMTNLLIRDHGFKPDQTYYSYFSNSGKMRTYGAELTLMLEPVRKKLLIETSMTYQKTEDLRRPDVDAAYSPRWLAYLSARYKPHDHLTCSITARYVDRILAHWIPSTPEGSSGYRIGDNADGYVSLGANIRLEDLFIRGAYLNFRAANILNQDLYYPTFTNNQWANRGTLGESRSFLVTLGKKF